MFHLFISVPSPDTHSNKPSPPSFLINSRLQTPPLDRGHTLSAGDGTMNMGFPGTPSGMLGAGVGGAFAGGNSPMAVGNPPMAVGGAMVGTTGQNLLEAMSAKFVVGVPAVLPTGPQSEFFQNAIVKKVTARLQHIPLKGKGCNRK